MLEITQGRMDQTIQVYIMLKTIGLNFIHTTHRNTVIALLYKFTKNLRVQKGSSN